MRPKNYDYHANQSGHATENKKKWKEKKRDSHSSFVKHTKTRIT